MTSVTPSPPNSNPSPPPSPHSDCWNMAKLYGPSLYHSLSPHMACFDYAAPSSQWYNEHGGRLTATQPLSCCVAVSQTDRVWDSKNDLDGAAPPEPKDSVSPPPSLPSFCLLKGIAFVLKDNQQLVSICFNWQQIKTKCQIGPAPLWKTKYIVYLHSIFGAP